MTLGYDEDVDISKTSNISIIPNKEERILYSKFQKSSETPTIISFLISKGIVKNEDSARLLLLIVTIIVFLVSIYFFFRGFSGPVFIDKLK
jgi:hypothetical protein